LLLVGRDNVAYYALPIAPQGFMDDPLVAKRVQVRIEALHGTME